MQPIHGRVQRRGRATSASRMNAPPPTFARGSSCQGRRARRSKSMAAEVRLLQACRFFNAGGQQEAFDLAPLSAIRSSRRTTARWPSCSTVGMAMGRSSPARNSLPASPHRADLSWPQHNRVACVTQLSPRLRSPHAPERGQVQSLSGRIRKPHARSDIRGPPTVQPVQFPLTDGYRPQPLRPPTQTAQPNMSSCERPVLQNRADSQQR